MEEYLIFSDESGSWSSQNGKKNSPLYVRSWVKIKKGECEKFDLRSNIDNILKQNKIEVLFTFTDLSEFYTRKLRARESSSYVENAIAALEQQVHKEYLIEIPKKVKAAMDYVLFLYIYEKYHIENAIERLWDRSNKYTFIFESPQFTKKDYRKVVASTDIAGNYKIEKPRSCIGLKIADRLARIFNKKILENLLNEKQIDDRIRNYYQNYICPNLKSQGNCFLGVNKIFLSNPLNLTDKEKRLMKGLRDLTKS